MKVGLFIPCYIDQFYPDVAIATYHLLKKAGCDVSYPMDQTCCLRAELGVAENGAMWISEKQMSNRLLPFICQHLVIILNPGDIVNNMHEAYRQIDAAAEGFGYT